MPAAKKAPAMPYTGSSDAAGVTAARPGTKKLMEILQNRGFTNLGIYANRTMRGSSLLSVHATGRALDAGYKQSRQEWVTKFADWLADNHQTLGIEEVHQYVWGTHGRGFRCNRQGKPGWLEWTEENNGGPGGYWLHIELSPAMADNANALVRAWKSCPPLPE